MTKTPKPHATDRASLCSRTHLVMILTLLIGVSFAGLATAADAVILEVAAGDYLRQDSVATAELPASLSDQSSFTLTRLDTNQSVPVQVDCAAEKPRVVWIIRNPLEVGSVRKYRLAAAPEKTASAAVSLRKDEKYLSVSVGGKPLFRYNHATVPSPDLKNPCYARSGYIHPLYNPSGQLVTDDFNPDHAHQHGIMFAWRKTTVQGRTTDGWDQKSATGRVEHVKLEELVYGPVFGSFTAQLRQLDLTAPGGPQPVLNETWLVRAYNLTDRFLFEIEATQTCAGPDPVSIDQIHYGGLAIRGQAAWHGDNYDYLTSQGKTKADGNQSRPNWVDIHGPVDGQPTGVTIFDHPGNFRFPQPVRLHPTMPYFCFTPASLGSFTIEPGKPYVSRYRFSVHDGELAPDVTEQLWNDYAHPPTVRIVNQP